jgi:hypothetical protein
VGPVSFDVSLLTEGVTVRVAGKGLLTAAVEPNKRRTKRKKADMDGFEVTVNEECEEREDGEGGDEGGEEVDGFRRGDVVVHFEIDWSHLSLKELENLLQVHAPDVRSTSNTTDAHTGPMPSCREPPL